MATDNKYTSIVFKNIYPIVEESLKKNDSKFRDNVAKFFNKNHELVFDIGPYDRIYYTEKDKQDMFDSLKLTEAGIMSIAQNIFYMDWPGYNPTCAKEPYVLVLMCVIRYYLKNSKSRFAELAAIYLCFSGKFYASLHGEFFKSFPPSKYRSVMDYVINNMLSAKFDIKSKGNLFGAIESMVQTYLTTYGDKLQKDINDEDIGKLIQQLRDREKSFLKNISNLYYEAFKNKNYLNYETENIEDEDNFRLTTNDANEAARITEATMNYLTSNYVSMNICNKCQDKNIRPDEIKGIIESILGDNNNLPQLKKIINIIICDYKMANPNSKVRDINFISYTIQAKPNTKNKYILELKSTIIGWLEAYSDRYKIRKKRKETAISYYRSILMYFTLVIYTIAQKLQ